MQAADANRTSPGSPLDGDLGFLRSLTTLLGGGKDQGAIGSARRDGYVLVTKDGPAPGFSGLVVGPPDHPAPGMIEYQDPSGKHLATQGRTPELYASLKEAYGTLTGGNATVKQAQADGYSLADGSTQAPVPMDLTKWQGGDLANTPNGTIEYETGAGKVIVDRTLTPELYRRMQQELAQRNTVNDLGAQGYGVTTQDGSAPGFDGLVVGPPDQSGPGMIEYQDTTGKHLALESQTPELYASLKEAYSAMTGGNATVKQAQADGYSLADGSTQAPSLMDLTKWQGGDLANAPNGTIEYETGNGKVIVDRTLTPELYKQMQQELAQRNTVNDLGAQGYGVTMQDGPAPGFGGLVVGPPDQFGPGMIEYQDANGKHLALASQTPELYESLKEAYSAMTGGDATVKQAQDGGYTLLDSTAKPPSIADITVWEVGTNNGTVEYQTAAGKFVVSETLTPDLYKQVVAQIATKGAITTAQGQGYTYIGAGWDPDVAVAGHVDNLGNGVIEFTDAKGDKYVTSQADNPTLYDQAAGVAEHGTDGSDTSLAALRAQYGVESEDDMNVLQKQAKDGKGTVQGEAMLNLYNKYNDDVTNNRVASDSNEAKFVRAMQAQSALQSGYQVLPYSEVPIGGGNHSSQDFGSPTQLTSADMQQMIDPAAVQKQISTLMQDPTVSKDYSGQVGTLLADVGVPASKADDLYNQITSPGYTQFLQAAKAQGLGDAAQDQVSADIGALAALDPARAGKASQVLLNNGITADIDAKFGDPSKISDDALDAGAQGIFSAVRAELAADNNVPRTVISAVNEIYDTINGKLTGPQASPEGKAQVAALFRGLQTAFSAGGKNGAIPADKLSQLIDTAGLPPLEKSSMLTNLQTLNSRGILGSVSGAISVVGAVYSTVSAAPGVSDNNASGDEGTRAIAATQGWLSFLSYSNSYVKLSSNFTKSPFVKDTISLLGLSKSLPDIWGEKGTVGSQIPLAPAQPQPPAVQDAPAGEQDPADLDGAQVFRGKGAPSGITDPTTGLPVETVNGHQYIVADYAGQQVLLQPDGTTGRYLIVQADGSTRADRAIYLDVGNSNAQFVDSATHDSLVGNGTYAPPSTPDEVSALDEAIGSHADEITADLPDAAVDGTPATGPGAGPSGEAVESAEGSAASLIDEEAGEAGLEVPKSTGVKIAATVAKSLTAVGDLGGGIAGVVLGALSLKTATTPEAKAVGALGIESGLLGTAAGGIEVASLAGLEIAGAGLIASVAFAAGAIFAFIGAAIAFAVEHKKESDAAKEQGKFFGSLADDGLMQPDWTEKLEYARYETHQYAGRDAPAGESIFNFQAAEYAHFLATPQQHGSSQNRLDPDLHVHYDSPESDPDMAYDEGLGAGGI